MSGGTDLVDIGGGKQLAPAAAASWSRARAAGCADAVTSAYRSPEDQARLRTAYLAALARGEDPPYVAPVSKSEHVTGDALDLRDPAIGWMRAHPDFGFVFTDATERWHVAYRPDLDRYIAGGTPAPTPPPTTAPPTEDTNMLILNAPAPWGGAERVYAWVTDGDGADAIDANLYQVLAKYYPWRACDSYTDMQTLIEQAWGRANRTDAAQAQSSADATLAKFQEALSE